MRAADIEVAKSVINASFRRYLATIGKSPDTESNPYDYLDDAVMDARAWVAEVDGKIVGAAQVNSSDTSTWTIDLVGVLEDYGQYGLGTAMMERIDQDAKTRSIRKLALITLFDLTWLWKFYERCGYTEVRRGPPPHGQDDFTRIFMEKVLI
jgi:N-acetylglutamate synthase-like GNAT family acetyltransferase